VDGVMFLAESPVRTVCQQHLWPPVLARSLAPSGGYRSFRRTNTP